MPRVLATTPGWLSRPSAGFDLFSSTAKATSTTRDTAPPAGPSRTIARRGTQIFVAVGNQVRWTDLMLLKDFDGERTSRSRGASPLSMDSVPESLFRPLKIPVSGRITQLSISPFGDYLAVVTSHTVHVVILHTQYELDIVPVKMKSFQVGPSQHVLECAPIASVLWHPLSPYGHCLVTLTSDAIIRLWELDQNNRYTFSEPQMSIDLGMLANAESAEEDLRAPVFGVGKSFMPDRAYLAPAAACFGGLGRSGENPWSPMTLWITTSEGDIYTLCPLLPSKFLNFPGLLRTLWDSVTARKQELDADPDASEADLFQSRQQEDWLRNLEKIDPVIQTTPSQQPVSMLTRPEHPRPEPSLQGPFSVDIADLVITDMLVRNIRLDEEPLELFDTEDLTPDEDDESDTMGLSVICMVTQTSTIHILLELEGIEGRWLHGNDFEDEYSDDRSLVLLCSIPSAPRITPETTTFFPSITPDTRTSYAFFVTHADGISYLSMEPWIERLRDELEEPSAAGSKLRIDIFLEDSNTHTDGIITFQKPPSKPMATETIPACVVLDDDDLGYMVVASCNGYPYVAVLDRRHRDPLRASTRSESGSVEAHRPLLLLPAAIRQPYQPDNSFYEKDATSGFLRSLRPSKTTLGQSGELTKESLDLFIQAHQVFSTQTQELSEAASRTFRACDRMLSEYHDQIEKVKDVANQIHSMAGDDDDDDANAFDEAPEPLNMRLQTRLQDAKTRQESLAARAKHVSKKLGALSSRTVSDKQRSFEREIHSVAAELGAEQQQQQQQSSGAGQLAARFDDIRQLKDEIVAESKEIEQRDEDAKSASNGTASRRIPKSLRKAKMDHITQLLERETSMVEATSERLGRLSLQL